MYYSKQGRPKIFLSGFSQGACLAILAGIVSVFDLIGDDDDFQSIRSKSITCPPLAGVHVTGSVVLPQFIDRMTSMKDALVEQAK